MKGKSHGKVNYGFKSGKFSEGDKVYGLDEDTCAMVHHSIVPWLEKFMKHPGHGGYIQKV